VRGEFLGAIFAVIGLALGFYLARQYRRRRAASEAKQRAATPVVHASRQAARKAEREQRKRGG
jgi:positive regulator of sigma E activity